MNRTAIGKDVDATTPSKKREEVDGRSFFEACN